MKKLLMTLVASVAIAVSANAQVFVGGSVGFGSVKVAGNDSEVTYKIVPEVGYNFNKNWAIGLKIGYQKGACNLVDDVFAQGEVIAQDVNTKVFKVAPYGRYTFVHSKYVNVFIDLGLGFASYTDMGTQFDLGVTPGVAVNLSDKLSFVSHIGFAGFKTFSPKGDDKSSSKFGLDVDQNNLTFGLYYNF